jgi:hypothetical protein
MADRRVSSASGDCVPYSFYQFVNRDDFILVGVERDAAYELKPSQSDTDPTN